MRIETWGPILLALVSGCASTPYSAATLELSTLPRDTEQRVLKALRHQGYRLGQVQRNPLRVQTRWSDHQRAQVPGWKRASVFVDEPATLNVVVEVRYLNVNLLGEPYKTAVHGDRELEEELVVALRDALQ
jgi:hypothetical protein